MHLLAIDWTEWLGFPVRVALLSSAARLLVALTVTLALGAALRAVLLRYARRFLERDHWSERARVCWPLRILLAASLILIGFIGAWFVSWGYAPIAALSSPLLLLIKFVVIGMPLWRLRTGFEIAIGALPRSTRTCREVLGLSLVYFPVSWLFVLILVVEPGSTPTGFRIATVGSIVYLLIDGFGAVAMVARAVGVLKPARESVTEAVRRAASAMNRPPPPVYEILWSRANAAALSNLGWVLFTSRAVEVLDPSALEAIAAHELAHLDEPRRVRLVRGFSSLLWLPMVIGAIGSQRSSDLYFGACLLGTFVLLRVYRIFQRRFERRADSCAHAVAGESYASALEELHRVNLIPVVLRSSTHPSLYDRLVAVGKNPDYARPLPPPIWPLQLLWALIPLALAINVGAFALAPRLMPIRDHLSNGAFYVAAALEGGSKGERAVVNRLWEQSRVTDAIALLNGAATFSKTDGRLLSIVRLELSRGDCSSAALTLERMKDSTKRSLAAREIGKACANGGASHLDD